MMKAPEKIEAAFSSEGTAEIPVVICYEGIYVRDHWDELTRCPWWYQHEPDIERQMSWRCDVIGKTGQDWFALPFCHSKTDRENLTIHVRRGEVFRRDRRTQKEERLARPRVGGWQPSGEVHSRRPQHLAQTLAEIDAAIPLLPGGDPQANEGDGRGDLAAELLREFGDERFPICSVGSPMWHCYYLWGFEGMMEMVARRPDLVERACDRFLDRAISSVRWAAAFGARGIWVEECFTDVISPQAFESLNLPVMRRLVEEIRALGLRSIYYYCGDPAGKWDLLFSAGADALSLEEGKKGFVIDIEEVVDRAHGRCTVLGNLDALGVLPESTEEQLRTEISRQISAGRRNGSRFIMSIGSPVTPETPVERVRLYCDPVRELGGP